MKIKSSKIYSKAFFINFFLSSNKISTELKLCNTKYETRSCPNSEALAAMLDSFVFLCYTIYRWQLSAGSKCPQLLASVIRYNRCLINQAQADPHDCTCRINCRGGQKQHLCLIFSSRFSDFKFLITQGSKQMIFLPQEAFLCNTLLKSNAQTYIIRQALPMKHIRQICSKIPHDFYEWKCYAKSWDWCTVEETSVLFLSSTLPYSQFFQFEFTQAFEKSWEILYRESAWSLTP